MDTLAPSSTAPAETKQIDWRKWLEVKAVADPRLEYGILHAVTFPYLRNRMCTNCGSHIEHPEGAERPKDTWGPEYFKNNEGIFVGINLSVEQLLERRAKASPKHPLTDTYELKEGDLTISFAWRNA